MTALSPSALRKACFDPVVDDRTCLLVLGSLPGEKSLVLQEYYGNRQNKFWALMSDVIGVDLVAREYAARLSALREHGVGLWDVVADAQRMGSLDSNIKERRENDLCGLLASHPNIRAIAFNGGTAVKLGMKILGARASAYDIVTLPSSSPAYTLPYAEKALRWAKLRPIVVGSAAEMDQAKLYTGDPSDQNADSQARDSEQ